MNEKLYPNHKTDSRNREENIGKKFKEGNSFNILLNNFSLISISSEQDFEEIKKKNKQISIPKLHKQLILLNLLVQQERQNNWVKLDLDYF